MIKQIKRIYTETRVRRSLIIILMMISISGIFMLLSSNLVGVITESIISDVSNKIILLLILFLFIEFSIVFLNYFKDRLQSKTVETMRARLKQLTLLSLIESKYEFSLKQEQGDVLARLNSDISSVIVAVSMSVDLLKSFILMTILSLGIFLIDFRLLILFFIPIILMIFMQLLVSKYSSKFILPWKMAMGKTNALAQDIINNRSTIKIFRQYNLVASWLNDALVDSRDKGVKGVLSLYSIQLPLFLLTILPMVNILIGGTYLVFKDYITVANFMSAFLISTLVLDQIQALVNSAQNIPQLMSSSERIFPILDASKEEFKDGIGDSETLIDIDNISFAYNENKIIDGLSMTIAKGELISLVGESGSGKTTLFNLISGLYEVNSGDIKVKGLSIFDWNKKTYRKLFSNVSQNTYLFNMSVRDNLLYIKPSACDEELNEVLKSVSLDISLDKVVGESGSLLSGGERQRLSIARALLNNGEIMLFDEATSALDGKSEAIINELLNERNNMQTRIIIAHRLESLRASDRIYYLDKGKILESGSHDELMSLKGKYYSLIENKEGVIENE